jgi:hypothetical protein
VADRLLRILIAMLKAGTLYDSDRPRRPMARAADTIVPAEVAS